MLKIEDLMEPVASKALISGAKEKILWRELYALLDRRLLTVKITMKNHIRVEEVSTLHHGPSCFTKDKQEESFPRRGRSPK
jgi:hypothetical protein